MDRHPILATLAAILLVAPLSLAGSRSSASYSILMDALDSGGVIASSGNYQDIGSGGLISGIANTAPGNAVVKSGYIAQLDFDAPAVLSAVSRKTHGGSGTFDINLPLTGLPGIECRTPAAGGNHQVVVTFATPVSIGGVSVMSIDGQAGGTLSVNGSVVTVSLSAVANAQTIGITLTNVNNGSNSGDVFVPMGVLLGDTSGNGSVNASDVSLTKLKSGQPVGASNCREDVTVSGSINASDVSSVKLKSGTALP